MRAALALGLALAAPGCGSLLAAREAHDGGRRHEPFAGVRFDADAVAWSVRLAPELLPLLPLAVVDLPLSAAADLLLLPLAAGSPR